MRHILWKDGDEGIPAEIKDRNGRVGIHRCKLCGLAEIELDEHPLCSVPRIYLHTEELLKEAPPPDVADLLSAAAATFAERAPMYGNSWKLHGALMAALFPNGVVLKSAEEFNRYAKVDNIAMKLARYCHSFPDGGHQDSAHDMIVYAAMLEVLTK